MGWTLELAIGANHVGVGLLNEDLGSYYSKEAGAYILNKIASHYVRLSGEDKHRSKQQIHEFLEGQHPRVAKKLKERIRHHQEKY